jgi:hypothetical protein
MDRDTRASVQSLIDLVADQLPDVRVGGVTDDVQASVIADNLEIAVVRCQPTVLDGDDLDATFSHGQSPRCLLPPIAGITLNPDLQWVTSPER